MKSAVAGAAAAAGGTTIWSLAAYGGPRADGPRRVGLVVQRTGAVADAAETAAMGAQMGNGEAAHLAEMLQQRFELVTAHSDGPESAAREALRLVDEGQAFAIAGALDLDSCLALGDLAQEHGFIFLNILSPDDVLRGERCSRNTFHIGASTAMYTDACAQWLVPEAGLGRWHFITSGSDAGQALYRRARRALLELGGTEAGNSVVEPGSRVGRPLLEGLRESHPDLAFLCLDQAGRTAFLELYNELEPPFQVAGPFASPERQWLESPETRAGVWPSLWHHKLFKYGAEQLEDRFYDRFQRPLDGPAWAGWVAVKILAETTFRARTTEADPLVRFLESDAAEFDGQKGRGLTFRPWDHQLRQPVYLVRLRAEAQDDRDVFDALAELPRGEPKAGQTAAEFLDQLGDSKEESACGFDRP